jgi:hypothetical protein
MLLQMFSSTPWSSSEGRRSSSQDVLPPVPAVQTDSFQGDIQGVCLDDLMVLEQLFQTNIFVYDLQEMEEGVIALRLV